MEVKVAHADLRPMATRAEPRDSDAFERENGLA
jgi:hypothetical protein